MKNPKFEEAILNKIGSRIDTEEIEKEIEGLEKQHRQLTGAKERLGQQVDLYEQEQPDGRFLKHIKFRFPVYFGDRETQELCWDKESTAESCALLSKLE